jgi:hypothetical protein
VRKYLSGVTTSINEIILEYPYVGMEFQHYPKMVFPLVKLLGMRGECLYVLSYYIVVFTLFL